ncbi:hypothetical protein [Listeria booriae]|uniref:hypothetical protein n=1 Tax=Listeria booriae TaxID=1552123 RepID=UPI001628F649|nr:hypothetical protein [Listeria booriae]MBC1286224.1 hypothetical protein [Listeria booriae]MBC1308062.1 hypothetical protein [Listeria booriae]MBC1574513.1 hypothetical protein [Listeria booriae]
MPHCEQVQHAISAKKHCLESMNELDEFLGSKMNSNSWYDEGFSFAQEMLESFNNADWEQLKMETPAKSLEWKSRLAYCVPIKSDLYELEIMLSFANCGDKELFGIVVDALRSFEITETNKELISQSNFIKQA